MSPRTLWTIILKIFGIYLVIQIYYPLTQLLSFIFMAFNQQLGENWQAFGFLFFSISIYLFLIIAFLFRTNWLIDVLKLDKSIKEEKIEFNIHRSTILTIAILLSGIILLVDSLPLFLKELYGYYEVINDYIHFKQYPRASNLIMEFVKLLISIFMLSGSRLIVNFIEHKRKGKVKMENPSLPEND